MAIELINYFLAPNGDFIASVGDDNVVNLWRNDGSLIRTLINSGARRNIQVFFSPDSQAIAVIENRKSAKIWSSDGKFIAAVELQNGDKIKQLYLQP